IRGFLKSAIKALNTPAKLGQEEVLAFFELLIDKTIYLIDEMIYKEEKILFPMCLDTLTEIEWYEVYKQSNSIGYCLLDPKDNWEPNLGTDESISPTVSDRIQLSTGSFSIAELEAVFSTIPVDLTFVDRDDTVKYYSHGKDRIFERNRAIIGRKVQFCHPPSSVHIVEKILSDFKSGEQNEAKFWINFKDKMVHIAYYAIRSKENGYLGTLEVTQDIKEYKTVEGERRLLTYEN
ncbi:MAG: PAS domain-containing protein, partial [Melioribacteraceae bacterium]